MATNQKNGARVSHKPQLSDDELLHNWRFTNNESLKIMIEISRQQGDIKAFERRSRVLEVRQKRGLA